MNCLLETTFSFPLESKQFFYPLVYPFVLTLLEIIIHFDNCDLQIFSDPRNVYLLHCASLFVCVCVRARVWKMGGTTWSLKLIEMV